jgi:hypothetical protein
MSVPSFKYLLFIILSILLIITLLVPAWEQQAGIALSLIFILFCLISTSYTVVWKHTKAYRQEKISHSFLIHNICVEITLILLAMVFAGIVGWYGSRVATGGINIYSTKLIIGIGIGLLVGWAVGLFMYEVSSRLLKT